MSHSLCSMTGFANGEIQAGKRTYKVQLKSVNHRFFEFRWRAPREWFALENLLRSLAKQELRRGFVDVLIEEEKASAQDKNIDAYVNGLLDLDAQLPTRMHNQMSLYERFDILIRNSDLWRNDTSNEDLNADTVRASFLALIKSLDKDRQREGEALRTQLVSIHRELAAYLSQIETELPQITQEWQQNLSAKFDTVAQEKGISIAEERVTQELLFIAERRDVAEEVTRAKVHLEHLQDIVQNPPADSGKRLDFLCQELHREWTTLSNKIQNQGLARLALNAKLEVEKLREQAQNFV